MPQTGEGMETKHVASQGSAVDLGFRQPAGALSWNRVSEVTECRGPIVKLASCPGAHKGLALIWWMLLEKSLLRGVRHGHRRLSEQGETRAELLVNGVRKVSIGGCRPRG